MSDPIFYIGLHQPGDARLFERACVSVRRLRKRRQPLGCPSVLLDSGAFTQIAKFGGYPATPADYAAEIRRLVESAIVNVTAAVAEDYMCEPEMLARTGLTIADHQRLTIERYDGLLAAKPPAPIMPVLQGYAPNDYVRHARAYSDRLTPGMWVGIGSVCKRNANPRAIFVVMLAIKAERPDLRLHLFGVKKTALKHDGVREMTYSADSLAWSYAARREGRDGNDPQEAQTYAADLAAHFAKPWQPSLEINSKVYP